MVKVAYLGLFALLPFAAASDPLPSWFDTISRVGVVGILALALYGLQKRWWVPGWAYKDLEERHRVLRERFDKALETALQSARGVERTASAIETTTPLIEEAIRRASQTRDK